MAGMLTHESPQDLIGILVLILLLLIIGLKVFHYSNYFVLAR